MRHQVLGTTMPVLEITLEPGEQIVSHTGELSWIGQSIELRTTTSMGSNQGVFGALKRVMGGGSLFLTEYTAAGSPGLVAFCTKVPGHILPVEIAPGRGLLVHRNGFLCATHGVTIGVGFQRRLGAGIFGGDGFVLQRLEGQGTAWIELDGEVVPYDLGPGETLRVHPGHVGMFEAGVGFDITMLRGVRNVLFGGDGLFLAQLTGPGKVWLQTLPLSGIAHALLPYLPQASGERSDSGAGTAASGIGGAILGGIIGSVMGQQNQNQDD